LGIVQARSGDLVAALTSLTEAVGPAEAHYNLAVILQEQNRLAEAENHLKQALALKSDLTQAQTLLNAMHHQRQENRGTVEQASLTNGTGGEQRPFVQHADHVQSPAR
jgi:tetratricopeptide (TPR) repeat protein